ncbi:hypothetical protein ACVMB0_004982 [Bradyrhizobium sp. USDA 4451]
MPEAACNAPSAPILTMRPAPDLTRCGMAARDVLKAVITFIACMRCQVAGSPSLTASKVKPPAMLISPSSRPKCAAALSIAAAACAVSVRSIPPSSMRSAVAASVDAA